MSGAEPGVAADAAMKLVVGVSLVPSGIAVLLVLSVLMFVSTEYRVSRMLFSVASSRMPLFMLWYSWLLVWYVGSWWLLLRGALDFTKPTVLLSLLGNRVGSLLWFVLVLELSRDRSAGFGMRRMLSLLLHRLSLFVWLWSCFGLLYWVSGTSMVVVLGIFMFTFVLYQTVVWELFLMYWLGSIESEDTWPDQMSTFG